MARRLSSRPALCVAVLAALGSLLAGCANSAAQGLVHQACEHVETSLTLYHRSLGESGARQSADASAAVVQLRDALPLAAQAAGESPEWQAFMTTLSEISRVPESDLVQALTQQCAGLGTPPQPANSSSTTTP